MNSFFVLNWSTGLKTFKLQYHLPTQAPSEKLNFLIDQNSVRNWICTFKLFLPKCPSYWRGGGCKLPGDPKKSIPLFGVSEGAQVFAEQLNRHIFRFPTKNLTILDQYFQKFHFQKKYISSSVVLSPAALLQIYFVEIILRIPVDISLIENKICYHN